MKKEVIKRMKELLGKFKLRFSYFLFIGIIGFILQFISYFLVASPVSFATLYAQKMSATFKSYVAPSYLTLFASLLGVDSFSRNPFWSSRHGAVVNKSD